MKKADTNKISAGKKGQGLNNTFVSILIVVLCFVVYGNSIPNHYSMDDELVSYNNQRVMQGLKAIPGIWTSFYAEGKLKYEYRPVVKTTFAIENQFFGQNPHISHFINILFYALTVLILYKILRKLFSQYSPLLSLIAILIFIVHPAHSEVICSLKNRDEILSFLGCVISLWFLMRNADTSKFKYLIYAFISYILAYFSKSSAIVFVAIFPLVLYFYGKTSLKKIGLVFIIILVAMLAARFFPKTILPPADRSVYFFENPLFFYPSLVNKISLGLLSLLFYVKILIIPHPLVFYYGYNMIPILPLTNPWIIFSAIMYSALFIYALFGIKKRTVLSFSILYFLISISMFSNLVKPAMGIVAERFVYAASLGFCIAVAYLILRLFKLHNITNIITAKDFAKVSIPLLIILIPFSAKTIIRNPDWNTHISLYRHDMQYLERSAKANALIASHMMLELNKVLSKGQIPPNFKDQADSVIYFFQKSIDVNPYYYSSYNNLATVYITFMAPMEHDSVKQMEWYKKAIVNLEKAIPGKSVYFDAIYNLAFTHERMGNYRESIKYYSKAVKINPRFVKAWSNMANIYNDYLFSIDTAIVLNEQIMKHNPETSVPYVNIATYYLMQEDTITAMKYFEEATVKEPSNKVVTGILYNYFQNRDAVKAEKYRRLTGIN